MDSQLLVAAQVSSLFPPTSCTNFAVNTKRPDVPLTPPSDSEHATFAEIFYHEVTGSILFRAIHDAQVLELTSLSTDAPPLRLVFPSAVLPSPSLMFSPQSLHVLAVTTFGSLFRLVIPFSEGGPLWQTTPHSAIRTSEYSIAKLKGDFSSAVAHAQDLRCVVLGLQDGCVLRLETDDIASEDWQNGKYIRQWEETLHHHSSFLNSLTSFLHPALPGGSQVISIASHPQLTDTGHVWTLSRDRTLRLWTTATGCVSERVLPSASSGRHPAGAPSSSANGVRAAVLLHASPQRLLRVFTSPWSEVPCVLAFVPTDASPVSGGFFLLFDVINEHIHDAQDIQCSEMSVHCHLQDFVIVRTTLYALWDRQGQSMVEKIELSADGVARPWTCITYPPEPELTPAYLDELLLSPGAMTDKFFEAVMRPGVFSAWTLHMAISQYTDACLSIPGAPAAPLLVSYATTAENIAAVVGCTVKLLRDPQTGAPQYDNYWNALKRDWEGFVARCREIERRARWPLAIGAGDPKGDVLVVERERIGSVVTEDLPLRLHRMLSQPRHATLEPQFSVLDALWMLRSKLGPRAIMSSEIRVVDILRQEIAFPYADIIQDTAQRLDLRSEIDDGVNIWISGRLQSVGNLEDASRFILDIVGGFDRDVKREEDEVELLLPPTNLEWSRALTAAYATSSINARYDLALALIMLLFYHADAVHQWEPSLLAEIFVVFRGVALLRYTSRQPAGSAAPSPRETSTDEDVIAKLRNMNVSTTRATLEPTHSLLHPLLIQLGTSTGLPCAAHHFLDATGMLQSLSPAHATKYEVLFCERLRLLGYREAAREVLTWLPRTPAMSYVLLRVWLDEGRYEDAAATLESLAGAFGPESGLSMEDREALAAVLPGAELFNSPFTFYLHAASLFKVESVVTYEVSFTQLALSVAPLGVDTVALWQTAIKGLTDLGLYDDAYTALTSCPYEKLKRDSASQLVYRMCEEHAVDRLMTYSFAGVTDEVEDALSFKARNADPRIRPFYSRILYTWYIDRGDYRNAALTMYQRARKLGNVISGNPDQFLSLAELQLEAYLVCINALSLIDPKGAWFILPISAENSSERRKLAKHIPQDKYSIARRDVEVVELADVQYEFALLDAQAQLLRKNPALLGSLELLLSPANVVLKLAQTNQFDRAIAVAKSLGVDMTDVFTHLTMQCMRLTRRPESILGDDPSDWLLTDKVSSWSGTSADRGWRYLRQALERHDSPQTGYIYSKITLETVWGLDRTSSPPPWLVRILQENHPEFLIRTCLRYEIMDAALSYTIAMIQKDDSRLARGQPRSAASTWLPYALIDQVLLAAESQDALSVRVQDLRKQLRTVISTRMKHVDKLAAESRPAV
ncbi:uncharacterized protein PHACADRAFT_87488 [Phanerochaete carnosa HHB-10118-sp]|uniref:Nucleoporin Nup120/160-domain-containing protein n=1 Tax=Phanerochaete carnosa (strain HHB-10118-sp) TaxID=650164 RepID=K5V9Q8_PHACS|nr:uncharacterized protein PHACADRAFT_87488 [Phanerochaete carnosa HHB-10118-sp]EKM59586.1 hypothetical protein PHACADRAFT_87488 [Phanerochaete carnosa HHB-10118-sp]